MLFFKKKKKQIDNDTSFEEKIKSIELSESKRQSYVVDMCEQMVDASKEYEDARQEYDLVTNYLNDVQTIEDLPKDERKALNEAAAFISKLTRERTEFLNTENTISDAQFTQMQELEEEMPSAIKRLKKNEQYLETIQRDMRYLEGEKTEWEIIKQECKRQQKQLRQIAILLVVFFTMAVALVIVGSAMFKMDTQLILFSVSFIAVAIGAYVLLKYQDCTREIKKSDISRNKAISYENRVKIKYVNTKNAIDYACEKYHVRNSYELNYIYEEYMKAVMNMERFRRTNDRLDYYTKELLYILQRQMLFDSRVWINYATAIVDKREMVELKHNLIVRRQKLRARMEYSVNVIKDLKKEVISRKGEYKGYEKQVEGILRKMDELDLKLN